MTRPIVIAATIPAHIFRQDEHRLWERWIYNADQIRKSHPGGVEYLLVIEEDARNTDSASAGNIERLQRHVDTTFHYRLDVGRTESTTQNRQLHLVFGQNLAVERALDSGADLLMVGASIHLPSYILPALLAFRGAVHSTVSRTHPNVDIPPIVGPYVPSYAQHRPGSDFDVAGFSYFRGLPAGAVLVPEQLLRAGLRWRTHSGMSDDFTLVNDAVSIYDVPSFVSLDTIADKFPATVIPLEQRPYDRRTA